MSDHILSAYEIDPELIAAAGSSAIIDLQDSRNFAYAIKVNGTLTNFKIELNEEADFSGTVVTMFDSGAVTLAATSKRFLERRTDEVGHLSATNNLRLRYARLTVAGTNVLVTTVSGGCHHKSDTKNEEVTV